MQFCDVFNVEDNKITYRLEIYADTLGIPKMVDIYCHKTSEKVSSYKYKICSVCIVEKDINIFPHSNDFIDNYTSYIIVKKDIKKILNACYIKIK